MQVIYSVVDILFIAAAGASLANLFDDCLGEGMIFERYGQFIKDKFWFKPLGGCIICTNVWIAFSLFLLFPLCPLVFNVLAVIGISNTVLRFIVK